MKSLRYIIFIVMLMAGYTISAQEKEKINVQVNGFVAAETFFDTRTSVSSRDGAILLYPSPVVLDANGHDLNASSQFMMTGIQSRLKVSANGFSAFGAKGSAVLEGDFVGTTNNYTGLLRLRHAFIKLRWENDELLAGKYWHPMFSESAYPRVLHWGAGVPFGLLSRAPQLRYTRYIGDSKLSLSLLSEMDFASTGPDGTSVKYIQNSGIPELNFRFETKVVDVLSTGLSAGYKTIKPGVLNSTGEITDEVLGSYFLNYWLALKTQKIAWNVQSIYGQNMYCFVMIGGYGVSDVKADGDYEYTNVKTWNLTSDIYTTTGLFRAGLNAGYSKNLGADADLALNDDGSFVGLYSRGGNIDYLYQFAPRIEFVQGKMIIAGEYIYTVAAYGEIMNNARVENADLVAGSRFLLHVKYSF